MFSEFVKRIKIDAAFRTKVFLSLSLAFNCIYSASLFVISRIYSSNWFFVMAIYYCLLSIIRIICFVNLRRAKDEEAKIKTFRLCGAFLLAINLVVSAMMFLLIRENQTVKYHEIIVIELATFAFCSLTIAIINCVKYLRKKDYLFSCVKIISLTTASVSMVTLTNTMLSTWGSHNELLRSIILPLFSAVVSIFILSCAVLMIRKANSDLRMLKNEKERW